MIVYQMFHLECHDIKRGLVELANHFANMIVQHLADIHHTENKR